MYTRNDTKCGGFKEKHLLFFSALPHPLWQLYTYHGPFKKTTLYYEAPGDESNVAPPRKGWKAVNGTKPLPDVTMDTNSRHPSC